MAPLKIFKGPAEVARQDIAKLEAVRIRLEANRAQARALILSLKAQRPEAELARIIEATEDATEANETEMPAMMAADEIRFRIEQAEQVIADADLAENALGPKLEKLHAELREAEAQAIDRQADAKQAELTKHLQKVEAQMLALSQLEDGAQFVSLAAHQRSLFSAMVAGGGVKTLPPDTAQVRVPLSERLSAEVANLRQQAAAIRSRVVRSHGRAQGYTLADLLAQMQGPGVIAPTESAVRAFVEDAGSKALDTWNRSVESKWARGAPVRTLFTVTWTAGKLNPAGCVAVCQPVHETQAVKSVGELTQGAVHGA